ncbi:MAG: energy transducer TonB [Gammaproteobacteria bacterium HGW-Gammaproteobacteria-11]|nr:MAG: energy transducer TonB [Gammaproteobacteria bacterium HGW-Gammaproteobacteria-11]
MAISLSATAAQFLQPPAAPPASIRALERKVLTPLYQQLISPGKSRPVISRREAVLLGVFILTLHAGLLDWVNRRAPTQLDEVAVVIPPMTIEFTSIAPPVVEPEPVIEPQPEPEPVVELPPEPVVDELAVKPPEPPKPEPPPTPRPQPTPRPVETPPVQTASAPTPAPAAAAQPTPAPPAPPVVTPPTANAAYLNNPAPQYPDLAVRRGWEGSVMLRVHVLANGRPSEIQIQTSSGRDALDQAAVTAVQRWTFVPSKRGEEPQNGWVSVPIDFRLN